MEGSDTDLNMTDVLRTLNSTMKQLNETMNSTMTQINETMAKISAANEVQKPAVSENPDEEEVELTNAGAEEGWEAIRDTLQEQDKETIDSWKDELNNLLVFAGLFSAVVTAFTVESYTWLQQDQGGSTNFPVTALPPQNITSSTAVPTGIAVPVNTLWVLSLTLSLISAFFAIAVQQWLRQLRLPGDAPIRRAVQLLSFRSDGLKTWQVPGIVSLLPLLLQVAVVLFLAGLFLLLRSLNTAVTVAFITVAATGLVVFLITTIMPLFSIHCPYKSPLVPTVMIVLQWLSYPFALLLVGLALPAVFIRALFMSSRDRNRLRFFRYISGHWRYYGVFPPYDRLVEYVKSFGRHMFVDMGQFWLLREYRHLFYLDHEDTFELEQFALIQVLLSIRSPSFARVAQCLHDSRRWQVFFQSTVHSLSALVPGIGWYDIMQHGLLMPKMAPYFGKWLSIRHHRLGWRALRQRDWTQDGYVSYDDSEALTLFHELDAAASTTRQQYVKHHLHICTKQRISWSCSSWETVPACLIFDSICAGYTPDEEDTWALVAFASKCFSWDREYHHWRNPSSLRLCLTSGVSALAGTMTVHPPMFQSECLEMVRELAHFFANDQQKETCKTMIRGHYDHPSETPQFMLIPRMIRVLCETLVRLAKNHDILEDPECDSIPLTTTLREICIDIDEEDINRAQEQLSEFARIAATRGISWQNSEQRVCEVSDDRVENSSSAVPSQNDAGAASDGNHSQADNAVTTPRDIINRSPRTAVKYSDDHHSQDGTV